MASRWRGILARVDSLPCASCGHLNPAILRSSRGPVTVLLTVAGVLSTGGVYAASDGLPVVGWPLIALGAAHYAVTWWTTTLPRGADLPGKAADSLRP